MSLDYEPATIRCLVSQRGPTKGRYIGIGDDKPHIRYFGGMWHCRMDGSMRMASTSPKGAMTEWFDMNTKGPHGATAAVESYLNRRYDWLYGARPLRNV